MKTRANSFVLASALAVGVLAACSHAEPPPVVGTLERHRYEVTASASEQLVQLPVKEGQRVVRGQLLAALDDGVQGAGRDAAAAELRRAQQRLGELRNGPRNEEIETAAAQLAAVQADRDQSAREYQRLADLAQRGLVAPADLDRQQRLRDSTQAAVAAAQAQLQLLRRGTRSEQIAQANSAQAAAAAQLAQQQAQLGRLQLLAPVDGVIEALPYRLGERPPLGAPVVIMLADGAPFARVYVPEPLRAQFLAGGRVRVRVDGVANPLAGNVRFIAGEASFTPYFALTQRDRSRLAYVAEIELDEAAARDLPVGVPVEVVPDVARE